MSEFSEYIDNYMNEKEISSGELSKYMNLDRTVIHRWRKGSRVPLDEETVSRIADALRMNVTEKENLLLQYDRAVLGELLVDSYMYVKELLRELCVVETVPLFALRRQGVSAEKNKNGWHAIRLQSWAQISSWISEIFLTASEQGDMVRLVMQPQEEVCKMLRYSFLGTDIKIEHIVCLEQNSQKSYENLKILRQILPLCFEQSHYSALYYYDSLGQHINRMSWFPNVIIVGEFVLQFDYGMEHGVLVRDPAYGEAALEEYKILRGKASVLMSEGDKQMGALGVYNKIDEGVGKTIARQPCLGWTISSDIYEKFLYPFPGKEDFKKSMVAYNGDWDGMIFKSMKTLERGMTRSLCTEAGMKEFMETGRVNEFPKDFYQALPPDVRRTILQRVIQLVRDERIQYSLFPENIQLPENVCFYLDDMKKSLIITRVDEDSVQMVEVQELGIYYTFRHFIEYIEKKNLFLDTEEVLERLEKLQKKSEEVSC